MFDRILLWAVFLFITVRSTTGTCSTGNVFIGEIDVNKTVQTKNSYVYNENFDVGALYIPIAIQLFNDTTQAPCSAYRSDVKVDCEITSSFYSGYSNVIFIFTNVIQPRSADPIPEKVTFTDLLPGREVSVQCWGVSMIPGILQFTKDNSMSPAVTFQIRPNATVNIYTRLIVLPNESTQPVNPYKIPVELSETPLHPVKIECYQDDTGVAFPMVLEFAPVIMLPGVNDTTVPFTMKSPGDTVGVYCTASTDPLSTPDRQFHPSSSTGVTSKVMIDKASIQLTPNGITVSGTSLMTYLRLDAPTESQFLCTIRVADNYSQAEDLRKVQSCIHIPSSYSNATTNITTTTTTTITTIAPPGVNISTPSTGATPSTSRDWKVAEEIVEFKRNDEKYKLVLLTRTSAVQPRGAEVVVLRCCSPLELNPDNPKYVNLSVGLIFTSHIAPNREFTWNTTTLAKDAETERTLTDPADVPLSPCPCDMTENTCDTNCCCDKGCDAATKETFTCIPGIKGGGKWDTPPRHLCTSSYVGHPGSFPFFCVHRDNSAFLGYFYPIESALRGKQTVVSAISSHQRKYSYKPSKDADIELDNLNYKHGLSVRTLPQGRTTLTPIDNYRLTLPQHTWTGQCIYTAPIQYLVDSSATCGLTMTEAVCLSDSRLNALTYIQATDPNRLSFLQPLRLLSDHNNGNIVKITVDYLCVPYNSHLLAMYLKNHAPKNPLSSYKKHLFGTYDLPMVGNFVNCEFDNKTGAFVCGNGTLGDTSSSDPVLPPRCSWDNGFVSPHTPVYDSGFDVCQDAVVEVRYKFTWVGTTILHLNATVILADVPLFPSNPSSTTPMKFNQMFKVTFVHSGHNVTNTTDEPTQERSGNPGYEFDRPLITGRSVIENETLGYEYVDMNESSRVALWKPGYNSLCEDAGRLPVMFGQDTMSECILRISFQELLDCNSLRMLILNRQDNMMAANYISLVGDADSRNVSGNWSVITRDDISAIINSDVLNSSTLGSTPVTMTTAAKTIVNTTATESPLPIELGVCENIPSGIHLEVLYADGGLFNGKPFPVIVAAKIRYTLSTWKLNCLATDGAACFDNATSHNMLNGLQLVQSFVLTTSATFTKIPNTQPARATLARAIDPHEPWFCTQNHCWEEVVYPFLKGYSPRSRTTAAIGLISFLFFTGLITMLTPWWVRMILVEASN